MKGTQSGPKQERTGQVVHNPGIGKQGNVKGEASTEGGQYAFMPGCESYSGSKGNKAIKAGQTGKSDILTYDFMPAKSNSDLKSPKR